MGVAQVLSRAQLGLDAPLVQIEAHLGSGLPGFSIVGLPAPVVRESRERVRSAMLNSGFDFPPGRITVNLAPVELAKEGGRYDLPIALALLVASGQLEVRRDGILECYGELGLDGQLRPVRGLLLAAIQAARAGHEMIIPAANVAEVSLVRTQKVSGFSDLRAASRWLGDEPGAGNSGFASSLENVTQENQYLSLEDVKGQWRAKRTLTIAAAGGHSLLMVGPPGSGKSMLAVRLAGLLPPLSEAEAMEVAGIASISGAGFDPKSWGRRPFRAPHHASSANAIVGGGSRLQPGEISLAHRGVLFMDELPEFDRRVLEALREPLESGTITLARATDRLTLPAEFQLIAAMNPCPCGYLGDPANRCRCGPRRVRRYQERLSGPLLDRIDLYVEVPRIELAALHAAPVPPAGDGGGHAAAAQAAREAQQARQHCCNARLDQAGIGKFCPLGAGGRELLEYLGDRLRLSARGYHRLLKVARTIADMEQASEIGTAHVTEAATLRPPVGLGDCAEDPAGSREPPRPRDRGVTGLSGPGNPRPT
jgi:magnesium chelatase family protein